MMGTYGKSCGIRSKPGEWARLKCQKSREGHATDAQVQEGLVQQEHKEGNDKADKAA